jgi:hypothetical protein
VLGKRNWQIAAAGSLPDELLATMKDRPAG